MTTPDPHRWPAFPEPAHVATLRTAIDAVRAYATQHATGLGSLACDDISARHVLSLLPDLEDE